MLWLQIQTQLRGGTDVKEGHVGAGSSRGRCSCRRRMLDERVGVAMRRRRRRWGLDQGEGLM